MGKAKSKAKRMLEEQIKQNNEILKQTKIENNEDDLFLQAMSKGVKISDKKKNDSKYPSKGLKVKVDLNTVTIDQVLSLLDFSSSENKDKQVQEFKLKTMNLLTHKDKSITRISLEKELAEKLQPFYIRKADYLNILYDVRVENEAKRLTDTKKGLVPFYVNYLKFNCCLNPETDKVFYSVIEEDRAFKLLKFYYDSDNVKEEIVDGQELMRVDVKPDLLENIEKKLFTAYMDGEMVS